MTDESELQDFLQHYGTPRKSGRYPWGSGENPHQRNKNFLAYVEDLKKQGISEADIAKGLGIKTTKLRAYKTIARNELQKSQTAQIERMRAKGMSFTAIGERMDLPEATVRSRLKPGQQEKQDIINTTANFLKDQVAEKKYLDIGAGTEFADGLGGISETKLKTVVAKLQTEGYRVDTVKVPQLGTGKDTTVKVLSAPGTEYKELVNNRDKIRTVQGWTEDGGRTFLGIKKPLDVDSKRVMVRYGPDGGADKDGVIEVREGVPDVSLGRSRYAQVRVSVDGTHYLKGMAMYSTDLPAGVDIIFNTNKSDTGNPLDAMKKQKDDPDNPFGSVVRQIGDRDEAGNVTKVTSAMNLVNEEGTWYNWSQKLSSQMMSKQNPGLAKKQLDLAYKLKQDEYDEIMQLTNPAVRKKLLQSFADSADASSVKLQAAGLPRTRNHVILPITDMPDDEVYAPNYNNGEKVVLIRHPHGGIFEIPELTVNNRHPTANRLMKNSRDAVGISPNVAKRLSGADFDGDTVLVIPNAQSGPNRVRNAEPLQGLRDFDPMSYQDLSLEKMSSTTKQHKMGDISNLITDMTILGAPNSELARAVRHSMVVIDAEKHTLDWRRSYKDNGIADLKERYQEGARKGAATLISKASSEARPLARKPLPAEAGGSINKATGEKQWLYTGETYPEMKPRPKKDGGPIDPETGKKVKVPTGRMIPKTTISTKMAEAKDAYELVSKARTPMEIVYADHANRLKVLANTARKEYINTKPNPYSDSARRTYSTEVSSLQAKLNVALKNAPLERQAQLFANAIVAAKKQATPNMEAADLKKINGMALEEARNRVGAKKKRVEVTDREWEAVQAGAISNTMLEKILDNMDTQSIKKLATPRKDIVMTPSRLARAHSMLNAGLTLAEIAEALGESVSTISSALYREDSHG